MSHAVVRPAHRDDTEPAARLLTQLGYDVPASTIGIAISEGQGILVAELDGAVVGLLTYATRFQLHRGGLVTTVDALVVDEALRSGGIGSRLLGHLVEVVRAEGVESVELHSNRSRTAAHRFYQQAGFELTSSFFRKVL